MAMTPAAGVVYRCPLCGQRFAGRQNLAAFPPIAMGAPILDKSPNEPHPLTEYTITAEIAQRDHVVGAHIASHSPVQWLVKISSLEQYASELRATLAERYSRVIQKPQSVVTTEGT